MPKPNRRYRLKADDVEHAKSWIEARVIAAEVCTALAAAAFKKLGSKPGALQRWCDRHLLAPEWRRLQAAIRSRRRQANAGVHVRLTADAYHMLHMLAEQGGVTLSEALLRLALPPPPPSPQVGRAELVKVSDGNYSIECVGQSLGIVMGLGPCRWIAQLNDGEVRAERRSAEKAVDAVLRIGRVIVQLGREGEHSGADLDDPFDHAFEDEPGR